MASSRKGRFFLAVFGKFVKSYKRRLALGLLVIRKYKDVGTMGNAKMTFLVLSIVAALLQGTEAQFCNICTARLHTETCDTFLPCADGVGCYSWTWLRDGIRYYQKGCQASVIDCQENADRFCTRDNAAICCSSSFCNIADPYLSWRPSSPKNVVVRRLGSTHVVLAWDLQCNGVYTYQVEYRKRGSTSLFVNDISGQEVTISGLEAGASYDFDVRSVHDGFHSLPTNVTQVVTNFSDPIYAICAVTSNSTLSDLNSTVLQPCSLSQRSCVVTLLHPSEGGATYASRNCVSNEFCETVDGANAQQCRPGQAGSVCHFCCDSFLCNLNSTVHSDLVCDNGGTRVECGWEGIDRLACESRGCCYQETGSSGYDRWCFHKTYAPPGGTAEPPVLIGGLSTWVIVVIVLAIVLLVVIIILLVYCVYARKQKQKSASYDCDAVYATPHKGRSRTARTITGFGRSNPAVTIEESP